jgi:hypothetical protein
VDGVIGRPETEMMDTTEAEEPEEKPEEMLDEQPDGGNDKVSVLSISVLAGKVFRTNFFCPRFMNSKFLQKLSTRIVHENNGQDSCPLILSLIVILVFNRNKKPYIACMYTVKYIKNYRYN